MDTVADVVNAALSYVGVREFIVDITEDSPAAIVAKVHYDSARKQVLGERWWNFASASLVLAQLNATAPSGWAYMYTMPSDMLPGGQREIFAGLRQGQVPSSLKIPFNLRWVSGQGQVLVTDSPTPELLYTRDVIELPYWPEKVANALAWNLAPRLALGLVVDLRKGVSYAQEYMKALDEGFSQDMNSVRPDPELASAYERVRGSAAQNGISPTGIFR